MTTEPTCVHHWHIEPANGSRHSDGKCDKCGVVKSFTNSIVYDDWAEARAWVDHTGELEAVEGAI